MRLNEIISRNLLRLCPLPIVTIFILLISCERDDICAANTPTTPNLQVEFFDVNIPDAPKTVNGLSIRAEGEENYVVFNTDAGIGSLPLRFESEGGLSITRFEVTKDSELDFDEDDDTNGNTDIIEITYTPEFVYVSRACGYKSIFNGIQITVINDSDNWILNSEINLTNIENEDETHITLFH